MTFKHVTVESVESATAAARKDYAANYPSSDDGVRATLTSRAVMLDGLPVSTKCAEFAEAIRKANRAVKFGVGNNTRRDWLRYGIVIYEELYAYIPGQQYVLGRFGYADNQINGVEHKFFVYARGIKNDKFNAVRDQYNMSMSGDMKRALDAAKKYLRPYSPIECARMTFDDFRHKVTAADNQYAYASDSARGLVVHSSALRNELFAMLMAGHQFADPTLHANITNWKKEFDTMTKVAEKQAHGFYVQITVSGEKQSFEVIEVFDIKKGQNSVNLVVKNYGADDLPEEFSEKIATLMMVNAMQYIEGVGMRTSDKAFWIER